MGARIRKLGIRTPKQTGKTLETKEKHRKALEMRRDGATFDDIATALKYANRSCAYAAVMGALADVTSEPAKEVKALERARLDAIYERAWTIATTAEKETDQVAGLKVALGVTARRSAMEGIDAPTKVQEVPYERLSDAEFAERRQAILDALGGPLTKDVPS